MRLIVTHIEAKLPAARTSHAHPYPLTTGSLKTQQTKKHGNHPMSRVFCFACAKRRFRLPIACVSPSAAVTAVTAAVTVVIIVAITAVAVAIAHIDAGAVVAPAVADIEAVVGIVAVTVIAVAAAVAAVIIIIAVTAVVAIVVIVSPAPFVCAVAAVNVYSAAVKLNPGAVVAVIH